MYVPLTIFYLIILFFQVNTTSSYLLGFLWFSQIISCPMMSRLVELTFHHNPHFKAIVKAALTLYGIWNLDFFRMINNSTCLERTFYTLSVLDMISGIYPLLLVYITYLVVNRIDSCHNSARFLPNSIQAAFKCFRRKFQSKTSLISAFSTLFLLSSTKLFNASFDLLTATEVYSLNSDGSSTTMYKVYLDGATGYFRGAHLPYGVLAITVMFLTLLLPSLCLLLYPLRVSQKLVGILPQRWQIFIHIFVDTFQGSFKNGTEPGSNGDYRGFSLYHIFLRVILLMLFSLCPNIIYFVFASMVLTILSLLMLACQPFKEDTKHNILTPSFLLYASCVYICLIGINQVTSTNLMYLVAFQLLATFITFTPLVYITIMGLHRIVNCI